VALSFHSALFRCGCKIPSLIVLRFIIKRVLHGCLVLFGVLILVFLLFNVLPGDPARLMMGQRVNQKSLDIIHKDMGLDEPVYTRFFLYLNDLSPLSVYNETVPTSHIYLDPEKYNHTASLIHFSENRTLILKFPYLRRSYQSRKKVSDIIAAALPNTAVLAFTAIIIASVLGIFMGIIAALFKDSIYDKVSIVLSVLGLAGPSFFTGLIIAWLFGHVLNRYTGLNITGNLFIIDEDGNKTLQLQNLILPALTLGIRPLAIIVQLTRNSMLQIMTKDYIRTAFAKGLSLRTIVTRHALKNMLNPVITAISGWFASLIAGAVFVEYIFGWEGIGKNIVDALGRFDLPVIMGVILVTSALFVIINILVDISYGLLDPRIKTS
jgi:peptide/nickel transport system permease protein